jgi:hypothetical protein
LIFLLLKSKYFPGKCRPFHGNCLKKSESRHGGDLLD